MYLTKHAAARAGTNCPVVLHDYMTAGAGRLTILTTGSSWVYIADDRLLHRSHRGQATGLGSGTGTREPGKTQSTKGFITFPSSKYRRHCARGGTPISRSDCQRSKIIDPSNSCELTSSQWVLGGWNPLGAVLFLYLLATFCKPPWFLWGTMYHDSLGGKQAR